MYTDYVQATEEHDKTVQLLLLAASYNDPLTYTFGLRLVRSKVRQKKANLLESEADLEERLFGSRSSITLACQRLQWQIDQVN